MKKKSFFSILITFGIFGFFPTATYAAATVTAPNGGDCIKGGSSYNITWTLTSNHVAISHKTDGSTPGTWQADSGNYFLHPTSAGATSYSWTVPSQTVSTSKIWLDAHTSGHSSQGQNSSNTDFSIDDSAPTASTASSPSKTDTTIDLSWTASTDAGCEGLAGYRIIRDGSQIASVSATTTYTDSGLSASTAYSYVIRAYDDFHTTDSNTLAVTTDSVADTIAPGSITDLAASSPTSSSIDLTWTAPGDDGSTGTATTYDIRYSTADITNETDWGNATEVSGEPTPLAASNSQSHTVTGLSASITYYFAIKTADEVPNWSGLSNVPSLATSASADTTVPGAISDLTASEPTTSSVKLTWTASGDDGDSGTAASYDIRYLSSNITDGNWSSATQVSGEPSPTAASTTRSMTISGLSQGTIYYFAIKTSDEVPNVSALSNVASLATSVAASTGGAVSDSTAPSTIVDLAVGTVNSMSVALTWTATGDDGLAGTATAYDMRYSQALITTDNWDSATKVIGEPTPKSAGSSESMTVSGLSASTTYYFALSASDEKGNGSAFSNVVSATTATSVTTTIPIVPTATTTVPDPVSTTTTPATAATTTTPTTAPESEKLMPLPTSFSEDSLIKSEDDNKIYVIKNNKKIWIPTAKAFIDSGYDWSRIKEVSASEVAATASGNLIRLEGKPEVYVIQGNTKRHIKDPEEFLNKGYKWEDVTEINESIFKNYLEFTEQRRLIRAESDQKVYYISENGLKKWIRNIDIFNSYNNRWEDVVVVPKKDLDIYPDVELIKLEGDNRVYKLEDDKKQWIKTAQIFNSLGYDWNGIISINRTEFDFYKEGDAIES